MLMRLVNHDPEMSSNVIEVILTETRVYASGSATIGAINEGSLNAFSFQKTLAQSAGAAEYTDCISAKG